MPNVNSSLTYRWFEQVWNNSNEAAIDELMHENAIIYDLPLSTQGRAGFKEFYRSFRDSYPEVTVRVNDVISEGDLETARCIVQLKDTKNKSASFTGMTCIKKKNNQIIEAWNSFDFLNMNLQLGFVLVPKTEDVQV